MFIYALKNWSCISAFLKLEKWDDGYFAQFPALMMPKEDDWFYSTIFIYIPFKKDKKLRRKLKDQSTFSPAAKTQISKD